MPTLIGPAVDPGCADPADVWVDAGALRTPMPHTPAWSPELTPPTDGMAVQVIVGRFNQGREGVIGELTTAVVEDWTLDVDLLEGTSATISCSTWDPLFEAMAEATYPTPDGHLAYDWDPKGYVVWIHVDGAAVWTGLFAQPIDVGDGVCRLPASGPETVFTERILGRAEQVDLLSDLGSFEGADPLDGWSIPAGVTATVVTDGVRGTKALRVIGDGWVGTPRRTVFGAAGYRRSIEGAAFGKWDDAVPTGDPVVMTRTQVIGVLGEFDAAHSLSHAGTRPDGSGWTGEPVPSGGVLSPAVVGHRAWVEVRSYAGYYSDYDLVTLRQGITTGAPPGSEQDLTWYVDRVMRDLHDPDLGGSPTGLSYRWLANCGTTATGERWAHNQRTSVRDVLTMILDRDGGPECRITTGWNLEVGPKFGTVRDDIAITSNDILAPGWSTDPGAQIEDFVVDTGRGSGTSWVSATFPQPTDTTRRRVVAIVQAPVGRTLNQVTEWGRGQADAAARQQRTVTIQVPWHLAVQLVLGDTIWTEQHDGLTFMAAWMRLLRMRWMPSAQVCELTMGMA